VLITVTEADIIDVGDSIYKAEDAVSGSTIQSGASGANQNWDFSNLQQNNSFTFSKNPIFLKIGSFENQYFIS